MLDASRESNPSKYRRIGHVMHHVHVDFGLNKFGITSRSLCSVMSIILMIEDWEAYPGSIILWVIAVPESLQPAFW
jgi:hypothetical protein